MNQGEYVMALRTLRKMVREDKVDKDVAHDLINRCLLTGCHLFDVLAPLGTLPSDYGWHHAVPLHELAEVGRLYGKYCRDREVEAEHAKEEAIWQTKPGNSASK